MSTMILAPAPVQQYTDQNGVLLAGGKLFCYAAGTTIKQAAFTDAGGATALPNPIILNVRGEVAPSAMGTSCGLWLDPLLSYKFVLAPAIDTDPPSNPIWTVDAVVSPQSAILAAVAFYTAQLCGVPVGAQMPFAGATAPPGWLFCYGQAVSRTAYAALFAVADIAYGQGDGATTFNLPDKRGRASIGADNMGGSAAGRVTQAVSGILATTVGQAGGDQHAQPDTLAATSTATSVATDAGHNHIVLGSIINGVGGAHSAGGVTTFPAPISNGGTTETGFANISVATEITTTVTTSLAGQSQNMMPVEVDNWIIFTGVAS